MILSFTEDIVDFHSKDIEKVIEEMISNRISIGYDFLGFCEVCGNLVQIPEWIESEEKYSELQNGLVQIKIDEEILLCNLCQLELDKIKNEERLSKLRMYWARKGNKSYTETEKFLGN